MDVLSSPTALGWASVVIGLTELLAPEKVEAMMGLEEGKHVGVLRVLGVRELLHGVDLLTHKDASVGVAARVAGDVVDGLALGAAAAETKNGGQFAAVAGAVMGVVAMDVKRALGGS